MMKTTDTSLLSQSAAADYLGVCPETLRHRVQDGTLVPVSTGDSQAFAKADLDALLDKSTLLLRQEVLDYMGIRSDRLTRLVRLGNLVEQLHPLYGRCYDREAVAALRGPYPWDTLMSSTEAARHLRVTSSTLRRWRQEGKVHAVHTTPAGDHLYSKASLAKMTFAAADDLIRGHEAARILGIELADLYNLDKAGRLAGIVVRTPGGRRRYSRKALMAYQARQATASLDE